MSEDSACIPVPSFIKRQFFNLLLPNENLDSFLDKLDFCVDINDESSVWSKDKVIIKNSRSSHYANVEMFFPSICGKLKKKSDENAHLETLPVELSRGTGNSVSEDNDNESTKLISTPNNTCPSKKLKSDKENSYLEEFGFVHRNASGKKKRLFHSTALGKSQENLLLVEDDVDLTNRSVIGSPKKENRNSPKIKKLNNFNEIGKLKEECESLKSLKIGDSIENEKPTSIRSQHSDKEVTYEECNTSKGHLQTSFRKSSWFEQFEKFVNSTPRSQDNN